MDVGMIEWHGQRSMYSCAVGRVLRICSASNPSVVFSVQCRRPFRRGGWILGLDTRHWTLDAGQIKYADCADKYIAPLAVPLTKG